MRIFHILLPLPNLNGQCRKICSVPGCQAGGDAQSYPCHHRYCQGYAGRQVVRTADGRRCLPLQAISDNVADASAALAPRDRAFIQHLDEVIYENMGGGDVSVDSVSVSMHMTTQQLRRKLLAVLGEAPNSYIRSLQIKRAHELLGTQTDLSISQIARLCGFYDMLHFSKIFKQCTGVSPSQYRKKE